jgi:hypothetical protein
LETSAILAAAQPVPWNTRRPWNWLSNFVEAKDSREFLRHDKRLKAAEPVNKTETSTHKSTASEYWLEDTFRDFDPNVEYWTEVRPSSTDLQSRDKDNQPHSERINKENFGYFEQPGIQPLYKKKEEYKIGDDEKLKELKEFLKYLKMKEEILRKIEDSTRDFVESKNISDEYKAVVLKQTATLVHDIFKAAQQNIPFEETLQQRVKALQQKGNIFVHQPQPEAPAPIPDLSEIPRWQGSGHDVPALEFLETHYGQWLSVFNEAEDIIFQDLIRKHDRKLLQGVTNQLHKEGRGRKLRQFVKPRSARTDRELKRINSTSLKHADRLSAALRKRQARARATSKTRL